jgi:hypothetical protein
MGGGSFGKVSPPTNFSTLSGISPINDTSVKTTYTPSPNFTGNDLELRAKQEEAARRQVRDTEQIKAQLANTDNYQVDMLLKMLSKINRDEVLSTSRTKDFVMFKRGGLTERGGRPHS